MTTIRRSLRLATFFVVAGMAGVGFAQPAPQNKLEAAPPGSTDPARLMAGKGRLGLAMLQISPELRDYFGAPRDRGVLVNAIRPDSPAAKAGVHVGDVIVELDGDVTRTTADMLGAMAERKKGDTVTIAVVRGHARTKLRATLEDDPPPQGPVGGGGFDADHPGAREWFHNPPDFEGFGPDLRKQLDDLRDRLDKLEHKLAPQDRS